MWINRTINQEVIEAINTRPALLLTGARQTGKSALLQRLLPNSDYITLDRVLIAEEAKSNPNKFLSKLLYKDKVILDEIQYAPSLFRELKIIIDNNRDLNGKWALTGSQKLQLMQHASESLAGRIRILKLETLSCQELRQSKLFNTSEIDDYIVTGGYPELWKNKKINVRDFFSDYVQTYLEKDLRELINIPNLYDFQRFMMLCAARIGQLINFSDLSKDVGVNVETIKKWLGCLEASGLIYLLPPYYNNLGKRLIKAPKLYFADHGLANFLVNIFDFSQWSNSAIRGLLWENLVFCELIKQKQVTPGRNLFFYRDQNNIEIDFVVEQSNKIILIEAKAQELPDKKQLNFGKVAPLFSKSPHVRINTNNIHSIVACMTKEQDIINLKDYSIYNPIYSDLIN